MGIFHGVNYDIIVCINGNQNNLCILVCLNNTEWMLVGVKCKKVLKKCAGYITIILLSSNKTKTLYKIQKRKFIDYLNRKKGEKFLYSSKKLFIVHLRCYLCSSAHKNKFVFFFEESII